MAKATEYCVALNNEPGTLGKLCGALQRAKVNVEAVSVSDNAECCWVRLVPSPPAAAKKALDRGKYHYCTRSVLTVKARNRPGELASIASRLGRAGVNIDYVYGSNAPGEKHGGTLVLSVDDLKKAAAALR